jgi:hypothetical protein
MDMCIFFVSVLLQAIHLCKDVQAKHKIEVGTAEGKESKMR